MAFTFNKQNLAVAFGVRYEPNMFLKGFVRCMCLLSMFRNENQPQNRCTPPTGRKTRCLFFSAFVLSTTQTSTTNKQEKTTIWTLCKLLWSSQIYFQLLAYQQHPANQWTAVILFVSWCFMSCLSLFLVSILDLLPLFLWKAFAVVLSDAWLKRSSCIFLLVSRRVSSLSVWCSWTYWD